MAEDRSTTPGRSGSRSRWTLAAGLVTLIVGLVVMLGTSAGTADALIIPPDEIVAPDSIALPQPATPADVVQVVPPAGFPAQDGLPDDDASGNIEIAFPDVTGESSNTVVIILMLTVLSVAPSLLVLTTAFTRIVIVLSLTRNAIGIPQIPPQQVVVGLAVFLTLFVMAPTFSEMNEVGLQPLLAGELSTSEAFEAVQAPLRGFLLQHTRESELALFLDVSDTERPIARDDVPLQALIPAFVLSELKTGFIIGFVIFVPFLVIDLVVSAVLMGLGMMMLPPSFVSLPFKLLLFVMLDGWALVVGTLLASYQ